MAAEALTSALPRITPLVLERRAEAFDAGQRRSTMTAGSLS